MSDENNNSFPISKALGILKPTPPEKFSGENDAINGTLFVAEVENYFVACGVKQIEPDHKVALFKTNLKSTAGLWATAWISSHPYNELTKPLYEDPDKLGYYDLFIQDFEAIYSNPDERNTAINELKRKVYLDNTKFTYRHAVEVMNAKFIVAANKIIPALDMARQIDYYLDKLLSNHKDAVYATMLNASKEDSESIAYVMTQAKLNAGMYQSNWLSARNKRGEKRGISSVTYEPSEVVAAVKVEDRNDRSVRRRRPSHMNENVQRACDAEGLCYWCKQKQHTPNPWDYCDRKKGWLSLKDSRQ